MSKLRCHISISLDGFVAGPNQSEESPLGEGGERLHDWVVSLAAWRERHGMEGGAVNESSRVLEEAAENIGAGVMGRNMFGPIGGGDWGTGSGTAGGRRPSLPLPRVRSHPLPARSGGDGGRDEFHFVTDGIESALEQARDAAGGKDVMLWGGGQRAAVPRRGTAGRARAPRRAGVARRRRRVFDNLRDADVQLEQVRAVEAPGVTHLKYRTVK